MKLLLLYPKSVDASRRPSRVEQQLASISATLHNLFADAVLRGDSEVHELAYGSAENTDSTTALSDATQATHLGTVLRQSQLVVSVCADSCEQARPPQFHGAMLRVAPSFPGSFVLNDIELEACEPELKPALQNALGASRNRTAQRLASLPDIDTAMHCALHEALPKRFGDTFYRSPRQHALVFVSYTLSERNEATRQHDKKILTELLHCAQDVRSITLVCEARRDEALVQDLADALSGSLGIVPTVWSIRSGDYDDLFRVLGKTDLAFFGGSSLYADAILCGVPAFTWRAPQGPCAPINDSFTRFLQQGDRSRVLEEQRLGLQQLMQCSHRSTTLSNERIALGRTLAELIRQLSSQSALAPSIKQHEPHWIVDPTPAPRQVSVRQRLSRSVWQSRRKLAKFRESPERFIADSNSRLARQVYQLLK